MRVALEVEWESKGGRDRVIALQPRNERNSEWESKGGGVKEQRGLPKVLA